MNDQHAAVQAYRPRDTGLPAIGRELGVNRKTTRRFAQADTSDQEAARALVAAQGPGRYQPK